MRYFVVDRYNVVRQADEFTLPEIWRRSKNAWVPDRQRLVNLDVEGDEIDAETAQTLGAVLDAPTAPAEAPDAATAAAAAAVVAAADAV